MRDLNGKVAVVTGAGSGIGRALAVRFAAEGMRVALADVEQDALMGTAALVDGEVMTKVVDVGEEKEVQAFADAVFDTYGAVHVLCNNAGVFAGGELWSRPVADFEWVFRVNLWGVLHGIRAFVPRMIAQDSEGHIVNTASVAGLFAAPFSGPYTISKFAAYGATESLAHELAMNGSKLRVSVLCPGGVATRIDESERNRPHELKAEKTPDQEFIDQVITDTVTAGIPPEDVAAAVVAAIAEERFLILTHPQYGPGLLQQAEALVAGGLPQLPDFEQR
ncbi:SDR family NAD(P)-dependent oxidoreductase [Actinocorallia longicatena]|uniref:SDR family NAD(P)-dependent oxidoreductase n=1 Tax=Actinocorallia longicatena TaxID=111803 RepID=A0ABP6Q1I6_9ACTN